MELSELRFPSMRQELIEALTSLADRDYQQRVWIDQVYPHENFYDDLTTTANIVYALIPDDENLGKYVGDFLVSAREVDAVERAYRALDALVGDLGDSPDERHLADPRWNDVANGAAHARSVLTGSSA